MVRLFVGVHHRADDAIGQAICLATEALCKDFVMGPKTPATHTFLVVDTGEGLAWRLDGQPPYSLWAPFLGFSAEAPAMFWEVCFRNGDADAQRIMRAVTKARSLGGTPYDFGEIAGQAVTAMSVLPFFHRLKMFGRWDLFSKSMICTKVVMTVLDAIGGAPSDSVRALPNLLPETLAQVLRSAEGIWTTRVT